MYAMLDPALSISYEWFGIIPSSPLNVVQVVSCHDKT